MVNKDDVVSVKIGGPAGMGVKSVGLMLAKIAARSGYQICDNTEYPSLIRGGHNVMQVNFSEREVTAPRLKSDLLIAFDQLICPNFTGRIRRLRLKRMFLIYRHA